VAIEVLTSIWQRVLQRSPIGINDDFFELGGTSSLAARLFAEIAEQTGQHLTPVTVCAAPTIVALAARLELPPSRSPLVLLKPGADGPPVFMTHGIGSSVIDLVPLARCLPLTQPIYGVEARGNDGVEEPFDRIEDMAQAHLDAIRMIQPGGSYFLVGYSLGGLVSLEVARRLSANGHNVALLAMLDSYPHRCHLSIGQHARLALQLAKQRMSGGMRASGSSHQSALARQGANLLGHSPVEQSIARTMQRVKEAQHRALRNYRPRFYNGRVKFVRAAIVSHFPSDPVPVWSHLVGTLEVETVPGDHVGMLTAAVETLARMVGWYVREAVDLLPHSPGGLDS